MSLPLKFKVLLGATIIILFVLWFSGVMNLWVNGISYVANNVERYSVEAYPVNGEYSVKIDLSDLGSNEGKVIYDDGENQIYISKIYVHNKSDYEVSFRSSGTYNVDGATLVSGIEHAYTQKSFTNHLRASATATYGRSSFKAHSSGDSGLNFRDGDEFGFYLIPHDKEVDIDPSKESIIEVRLSDLVMNKWVKK